LVHEGYRKVRARLRRAPGSRQRETGGGRDQVAWIAQRTSASAGRMMDDMFELLASIGTDYWFRAV